jgi:hypothetical protein
MMTLGQTRPGRDPTPLLETIMKSLIAAAVTAAFAALALAGPAAACPDYTRRAAFGTISLNAGFLPDPYVRNITAGGRYDLAGCLGFNGWGGSVAAAPDFQLNWSGNSAQLTIAAQVPADAVLLVNGPNGQFYWDDDTYGTNPVLTFVNPQQGVYDIWIGAYGGGRGHPGQLIITELNY